MIVAIRITPSSSSHVRVRAQSGIVRLRQLRLRFWLRCVELRARSRLGRPAAPEARTDRDVSDHSEQDEDAQDRVAPELAHLLDTYEALVEQVDQHGAQKRADECARTAEHADAADD